ncbi:RNA-binding domain superfamily [Arabidopsis suecica]|uniref:RNA-binding domain superfamily n=1 Tax=Arabidopsis suecica TaxID=45249 RepID=A0A8T1XXL9_ARASU|nr:RNA-binding domain superfamily [Arabidopsis suecica]
MGKSSKSLLGSPSQDKLETVNPKKRHKIEKSKKKKIASIKLKTDSLKDALDSLKEDVDSLKATVNSVKSTLDLLLTREDFLALFTAFKEPAKKPASVKNNVIPVIQNSPSSEGHKKSDEGEEPAHKKAKADTNTCKKESSSNVSSKESDVLEKETLNRTLPPCSSSFTKTAEVGERVLFIPKQGGRYDGGTIFVKGYDSSLGENDIARALLEHFSPCGMISKIYFQTNETGAVILRHVFIEMLHGTEDALKLNGSDMGGCNLEVHNAKDREEYYINREASGRYIQNRRHLRLDRLKFTREKPPVYGIVSSSKINK